MSLLCGQRCDIKKVTKRDLTGQTCFGTFIRRSHKTTRQATHRIILVTDVYTRNIMQRQEKDPLGQMFAFILLHPNGTRKATCHRLSSPTQFPWLRLLWGSGRVCSPPPRRRRTSAAARPPRRGRALLPCAAASHLSRERRPRGLPHRSRRERTRVVGKLASCASCASLNIIISPTQALHAIWQKNARRNTRRGGSCCQWRSCD